MKVVFTILLILTMLTRVSNTSQQTESLIEQENRIQNTDSDKNLDTSSFQSFVQNFKDYYNQRSSELTDSLHRFLDSLENTPKTFFSEDFSSYFNVWKVKTPKAREPINDRLARMLLLHLKRLFKETTDYMRKLHDSHLKNRIYFFVNFGLFYWFLLRRPILGVLGCFIEILKLPLYCFFPKTRKNKKEIGKVDKGEKDQFSSKEIKNVEENLAADEVKFNLGIKEEASFDVKILNKESNSREILTSNITSENIVNKVPDEDLSLINLDKDDNENSIENFSKYGKTIHEEKEETSVQSSSETFFNQVKDILQKEIRNVRGANSEPIVCEISTDTLDNLSLKKSKSLSPELEQVKNYKSMPNIYKPEVISSYAQNDIFEQINDDDTSDNTSSSGDTCLTSINLTEQASNTDEYKENVFQSEDENSTDSSKYWNTDQYLAEEKGLNEYDEEECNFEDKIKFTFDEKRFEELYDEIYERVSMSESEEFSMELE